MSASNGAGMAEPIRQRIESMTTTLLTVQEGGSLRLIDYTDADLAGAIPTAHVQDLLGWGHHDGKARLWRVYTGDGERYREVYVPLRRCARIRRLAGLLTV